MTPAIGEDLQDRIYEAAFVPELWPGVLDDMVRASGSVSGAVVVHIRPDKPPLYRTTSLTREALDRFVSTDRWRRSGRAAAVFNPDLTDKIAQFLYVADYMSNEQKEACSVEQSLRELGLGEQLQTAIPMPSGEFVGLTFEKWAGEGRHSPDQITMMNGLRPHLARAGLIASRLELKQACNMVGALSALGLPAAVLRQSGGVLSANDLFEALNGLFVARAFGGLAMADRNADRLLQVALETSRTGEGKSPVRSIPVAMQPGRAAHVVHLVPLRRAAHDIFASADMLVVVSTVSRPAGIPLNTVVTALFDLSPAESRLAMNLARGIPLAEAAQVCGITISSARTYLNRIFQKTGTHRQGELVALLLGAQLLAPLPG